MPEKAIQKLEPGGFFGNYRVVKKLGSGGTGEVFLVDAPEPGRSLAVKIFDPKAIGLDPETCARFIRSAEFSTETRHPCLVDTYDAGQDPETGLCFLVMEHMAGGSLRDVLKAFPGGMPVERAVAVAKAVAHALAFVERNGLVHRDIKPDNILFTADGVPKLADLGTSRFSPSAGDMTDPRVTSAGSVVGTPAYMSPEQMRDSHAVDIRADIYSMGVMLYEMLAGRRPNAGDTAMRTLAKALCGEEFPDVRLARPEVPAPLAALVAAMTRMDAKERPRSATEVVIALESCLARAETERPARQAAAEAAQPWYKDGFLVAAAAAFAAATAVAVAAAAKLLEGGAR